MELVLDEAMKDRLFETILNKPDVFYRNQQKDEPDLTNEEKKRILRDLFDKAPSVFLDRYHSHISKEFIDCFPKTERCQPYLDLISSRKDENNRLVRNRRFAAMEKLKQSDYFSLVKMRERAPFLFDTMIGDHLHDSERIHLRPTVDQRPGSGFSNLMEQFDESQRIAERRKRHFAEYESCMMNDRTDRFLSHVSRRIDVENEDFEMEFDSDDDEGREAEAKRVRRLARYTVDKELPTQVVSETTPSTSGQGNIADETTRQLSELKVVEEDTCSSIAPNNTDAMDSTGIEHDALIDEFRSIMENRFMCGEDDHVDYKQIDSDESIQASKWREQDIEDAYFGDSESCSES